MAVFQLLFRRTLLSPFGSSFSSSLLQLLFQSSPTSHFFLTFAHKIRLPDCHCLLSALVSTSTMFNFAEICGSLNWLGKVEDLEADKDSKIAMNQREEFIFKKLYGMQERN